MTPDKYRETVILRNTLAQTSAKAARNFGLTVEPVPNILSLSIQWHIKYGRG